MSTLPVSDPAFWSLRFSDAVLNGNPHHAIYIVDIEEWKRLNEEHRDLLKQLLPKIKSQEPNFLRILDAGCGYGALAPLLPLNPPSLYVGIDISPDLISYGLGLRPSLDLRRGDLRKLDFPDKYFDVAVARSVEGMVIDNLGHDEWLKMEKELQRVATTVLLLNYSKPRDYTILDGPQPDMGLAAEKLEVQTGYLTYRYGADRTIELLDIWVDEDMRMLGIATHLMTSVINKAGGTVYGFTRASNKNALRLYTKLGFRLLTIPNYYRGEDGVMLYIPFTS